VNLKCCSEAYTLSIRMVIITNLVVVVVLTLLMFGDMKFLLVMGQDNNIVAIARGSSDPHRGQFFVPPQKSVPHGTTIVWTNDDNVQHTVTSFLPITGPTIVFDSNQISPNGGTFKFRFDEVGTYNYYCKIHPFMTGQVIVR
jgi:plastocyanin